MFILVCEICVERLTIRKRADIPRKIEYCSVCGHELEEKEEAPQ
jgi:hypothetical protein